jgi:hypothetical protein
MRSWPKQGISRKYFWTDWENPQTTQVRLAGFPVDILTRHLPDTCVDHYRYWIHAYSIAPTWSA